MKLEDLILVSVDEPTTAHYGSEVAAPGFQRLATKLMEYWHVPKDDPESLQAKAAIENGKRSGQVLTIPGITLARN